MLKTENGILQLMVQNSSVGNDEDALEDVFILAIVE